MTSFQIATLDGAFEFVRRAVIPPKGDPLAIRGPRRPKEPVVFRTGHKSAQLPSLCAHQPDFAVLILIRHEAGSEGDRSAIRRHRESGGIIAEFTRRPTQD